MIVLLLPSVLMVTINVLTDTPQMLWSGSITHVAYAPTCMGGWHYNGPSTLVVLVRKSVSS